MKKQKYGVMLTYRELRILRAALIEWRNWLIRNDFPTEDVDQILMRLWK